MKKHQLERSDQTWRQDSGRGQDNTSRLRADDRAPGRGRLSSDSDERMINKEIADRKRAEYLRMHDDDEAEIDPR